MQTAVISSGKLQDAMNRMEKMLNETEPATILNIIKSYKQSISIKDEMIPELSL